MITQTLQNLPDELKQQPRFFPVTHDKKPKIKAWNKTANQCKYDQLESPVGFAITNLSPFIRDYLVFDFDHVLDDQENFVTETAKAVYEQIRASGTYGEISQSGHGFHFVFNPTSNKFSAMNPAKLYLDDKTDLQENQRAKLEIFYKGQGRFFIFTGNILPDSSDTIIKDKPADNLIEDILRQVDAQKSAEKDNTKPKNTEDGINLSVPQNTSVFSNTPSDLERAKAMLEYIDPTQCSYDDWIAVGMIIKNIGGSLEIWDDWSSRDEERYNKEPSQTCSKKWESFQENGELNIGSLHKMAQDSGYSEATFQRKWRNEHNTSSHIASDAQTKTPTNNVPVVNMQNYLSGQYDEDLKSFRAVSKITTGFDNLDKKIDGISPGLYVIGAIPSLGKTTFIHQIADNIAMTGEYVLLFSLEQTPMELASKSIARECYKLEKTDGAPSAWSLQNNLLNDVSADLAGRAFYQYKNSITDKLIIIPGIHSISLDDIIDTVENFIKEHNVTPVVIIDYLQIINLDGMNSDKMRIDHITSSLKQLQSRNDLALFVISSFNRSNYMQVVDYESFKESGHIEYSADAIWGLQLQILSDPAFKALDSSRTSGNTSRKRDMVDEAKRQQPRKIELKALKHRNHPLYSVGFSYHSAHDFFEPDPNYSKPESEENTKKEETSSQTQTTVPPER